MLALIGWDGAASFGNYEHFTPNRWENVTLPYRLTQYEQVVSLDKVAGLAHSLQLYYRLFTKQFFGMQYWLFIGIFSESLANLVVHGGEDVKNALTVIRHYHPADSSHALMHISNPNAKEWDYEKEIRENPGRGGFTTFKHPSLEVSYANGGRDFLAVIDLAQFKR